MLDYEAYTGILQEELVLATGCTEPIALAYLAAVAKEALGSFPSSVTVFCSPNIVKNVKSVTIPNTNNLKGIEAAIIAGLVAGNADKKMEVITDVTSDQIKEIERLHKSRFVTVKCKHDEANLNIKILLENDLDYVIAQLMHTHTNITLIEKNGKILYENKCDFENYNSVLIDRTILNIDDIITYASTVELDKVKNLLFKQIEVNSAIAEEGLKNPWGACVGKTLRSYTNDIYMKGIQLAAAASDARMAGCKMPVMTNSGSGNQGLTCSLPVINYAKEKNVSEEKKLRALLISNLVTIHIKTGIGRLSAYCGVVCAATGAYAGIAYLDDSSISCIKDTITNSLATSSGMICDGAKESCASKISTALFSATLAYEMAKHAECFKPECGIVQEDVENTIKVVGQIGRVGMKETDEVVLDIMTDKK